MDPTLYFEDLSKELKAVQNRIRNLIGNIHWPSDGAWKESVLRSVLRTYLPPSYTVGSGFFVTADGVSSQIDILICDDSAPMLFRDGDFLITTADNVRAVIEVKTQLSAGKLRSSVEKLNTIATLIRKRCVKGEPFIGLFSYEGIASEPAVILEMLQEVNGAPAPCYPITSLCFGDEQFYRFWEFSPTGKALENYESWNAYKAPNMAPGYFVHTVILDLFPHAVERAQSMWYPNSGMSQYSIASAKRRVKAPPQ